MAQGGGIKKKTSSLHGANKSKKKNISGGSFKDDMHRRGARKIAPKKAQLVQQNILKKKLTSKNTVAIEKAMGAKTSSVTKMTVVDISNAEDSKAGGARGNKGKRR